MSGMFVLFVGVALLAPLLLYYFTERETANPTVVSRSEAEQIAQKRGGRPDAREADDSDEWGVDEQWGEDGSRR
jgi:hypothetical protein